MNHFISIAQTPIEDLRHILDVAHRLKTQWRNTHQNDPLLANKTLAMIFEKPSLRTRVSFEVATRHLGGNAILLRNDEVGLGVREPVKDIARVLSGMCDGIMARTFEHEKITGLAEYATIPIINGLTDYCHPCQAMADLMTIEESMGSLAGRTLTFIGDGNNVARSLARACVKFGMKFIIASPTGYELPEEDLLQIKQQYPDSSCAQLNDPREAVKNADVVYTDTWISMGQEDEKAVRVEAFEGYQINNHLLALAHKDVIVLHCLPAYRGLEITDQVVEGPHSRIFQQAENRLHAQKGLLAILMGGA